MHLHAVALLSAAALAAAKNIRIDVGDGGLVFTPNSTKADKGDTLQFFFSDSPHSVVAGDFSKACQKASTAGFYSGTLDSSSMDKSTVFEVKVENTDPLFYYCAVGRHCPLGMVGVVNPSGGDTLDKYASAASDATSVAVPSTAYGGSVKTVSGSATATTTGTSTATTTGSSSAASDTGSATTSGAQSTGTGAAGHVGAAMEGVLLGAAGVVAMLV